MIACTRDKPEELLLRRGAPPAVEGCYAVAAGADTVAVHRVRAFRLDLRPVTGKHPEINPARSLVDSVRDFASHWSADSLSDTVRVAIGDLFTSEVAIVAPSPGGLRGRAIGVGEDDSERSLGDVTYTKQPCASDN